jgi:hypothetical protein
MGTPNVSSITDITKFSADKGTIYMLYNQVASATTNNTTQDALYLVVGPKVKINDATLLYIKLKDDCSNTKEPQFAEKVHVTLGSELTVKREFDAVIKDEYKSQTIIGVWAADKSTYGLMSTSFSDMYDVTPTDAPLAFDVDKTKQNDYVKEAIEGGKITFVNNVITFAKGLDAAQIKEVKVDLYDGTVDKDNFYRTDTWAVRSPLQAWSGTANLGKVNEPSLHYDATIDITDNVKTAWAKLALKDYIGQTVVAVGTENKKLTGKLKEEISIYTTLEQENKGLKCKTDSKDWEISDDASTLTFKGNPSGSVYDKVITITVTYTHDYGTSSFTSTIQVIGDAE